MWMHCKEPNSLCAIGKSPVRIDTCLEFVPGVEALVLEGEPVGAVYEVAAKFEDMDPGEVRQHDFTAKALDCALYLLPDCVQHALLAVQ